MATTRRSSTGSGCGRRISTTARCRRCAICSKPPEKRPKVFWRGYDLYDPVNVGFVSQGAEAQRIGTKHETSARAGSSQGHAFGTALTQGEKDALIEYLKTL